MSHKAPAEATREPRNEKAAVALTKSEKDALRLVATIDGPDESTLLRENLLADIMARADEIRRKVM
jgi:hypothetical protein